MIYIVKRKTLELLLRAVPKVAPLPIECLRRITIEETNESG